MENSFQTGVRLTGKSGDWVERQRGGKTAEKDHNTTERGG